MQIGRKIYYDKPSGNVICDTGERMGNVRETTQAEDFVVFPALIGCDPSKVSMFQLAYGERADEFARYKSGKVVDGKLIIEQWTEGA